MFDSLIEFIRTQFPNPGVVPLHAPLLGALEKRYLSECIDSTFVSSVGPQVDAFEQALCQQTGRQYAVAMVNGTAALHLGLVVAGVVAGSEVIVSAMTFIATANAVNYCGADPIFVDIEPSTLGICPTALRTWLSVNCRLVNNTCVNQTTGKTVKVCLCTHIFGHPARMNELVRVCEEFHITLVEDAAEALGSYSEGRHVGGHGLCAIFSFNGNKILTTGGGGALVTDDPIVAKRVRHLATTAKKPHRWESCHDEVGYNFRMPNLNAALGCAQLERLDSMLIDKRNLARAYINFTASTEFQIIEEAPEDHSNYWLNAVLCTNEKRRNALLEFAEKEGVQLRPVWQILPDSVPYRSAQRAELPTARDYTSRLINLPSSSRLIADA